MEESSSSNDKQTTAAIIAGAVIVGVALLCACMVVVVAIFIFRVGSVTNPIQPPPSTAPPPEEPSTPPPPPDDASGTVTIQAFTVEPGRIQAGECVEFSWSVSGADSIQLLRDETVILENAQGDDSYHECLDQAGIFRYRLEASNQGGFFNWMELQVIVD